MTILEAKKLAQKHADEDKITYCVIKLCNSEYDFVTIDKVNRKKIYVTKKRYVTQEENIT